MIFISHIWVYTGHVQLIAKFNKVVTTLEDYAAIKESRLARDINPQLKNLENKKGSTSLNASVLQQSVYKIIWCRFFN